MSDQGRGKLTLPSPEGHRGALPWASKGKCEKNEEEGRKAEEKNRNWKAAKGNFALFKTSRKQFDEMEFVPGAKCRPHERLKQ